MEKTNIEITQQTWKRLNSRKESGDSFDDVVVKLLDATDVGKVEVTSDD